MQRAKPREVEVRVELRELADRPIPRFVGRLARERKVPHLCGMEALFEIGLNNAQKKRRLARARGAEDFKNLGGHLVQSQQAARFRPMSSGKQ